MRDACLSTCVAQLLLNVSPGCEHRYQYLLFVVVSNECTTAVCVRALLFILGERGAIHAFDRMVLLAAARDSPRDASWPTCHSFFCPSLEVFRRARVARRRREGDIFACFKCETGDFSRKLGHQGPWMGREGVAIDFFRFPLMINAHSILFTPLWQSWGHAEGCLPLWTQIIRVQYSRQSSTGKTRYFWDSGREQKG